MLKSDPRSAAGRPEEKSKRLGQVFTPAHIAKDMATWLFSQSTGRHRKILDPCVGPCTFPGVMYANQMLSADDELTALDVDPDMIHATSAWAETNALDVTAICDDYLLRRFDHGFDLAILNPPYIRQEWLDRKAEYQALFRDRYGLKIPGTSNLYVYFMAKIMMDLKPGGHFACIVYDSWQSTQFGRWLNQFLLAECSDLTFVPVADQPFFNRLIDATVILGTKKLQRDAAGSAETLATAEGKGPLRGVPGFRPIGEVFESKRGLRLKQADFFLCNQADAGALGATPFFKKIGKVRGYSVPADHPEAALLIEEGTANPRAMAELNRRVELAQLDPKRNESILTWFRERPDSWFMHREAPLAPILFNYYLRNRPRHLYNPERPYADNFYGLTIPESISPLACLSLLNSTAVCVEILANARNQGNGLAKIQLFEYRAVAVPDVRSLSAPDLAAFHRLGLDLVERPSSAQETIAQIDQLIAAVFAHPLTSPGELRTLFATTDQNARKPKEVV